MALKRRAFLQRAIVLATLGLSEASFGLLSQRYAEALAQPNRRKLALLVGINQYPESVCGYAAKGSALNGCLTDVELQYQLLVHRFGFAPSDIRVLTDQAATREGIETAFLEHLIQQATPGDLVLVHFSGLGSQVQLEDGGMQTSLVPIDGLLPTAEHPVVQDLMQETLTLLLHSLLTRQVITVLDAGYSSLGRNSQGGLRIRSRPQAIVGTVAEAELAFQARLRSQMPSLFRQTESRQADLPPGFMLRAGADRQMVAEAQWNGFSAGLLTYALTQQLWGETSVVVSLSRASAQLRQITGAAQQPVATGQPPSIAIAEPAAVGVIRELDAEGKPRLWLAGLPAVILENQTASLFEVAEFEVTDREFAGEPNSEPALLQLRSRDGLVVKARGLFSTVLQPGQLLREVVRILPRTINLTVGFDANLKRIERVDATSAFATIPRISVATSDQSSDLWLGKAALVATDAVASATQDAGGYGLFDLGGNAIPNTLSPTAEAVKTAVTRLTPQLKTYLAVKLLRLTETPTSSKLAVQVTVNLAVPQSPVLQNHSDRPVYFLLIGLNANAMVAAFSPSVTALASGETIQPLIGEQTQWVESYLIVSTAPFTKTHQLLSESTQFAPDRILNVTNPLEVVEAILQDLHQASAAQLTGLAIEIPADTYVLDLDSWASFSLLNQDG